MPPSSLAAGSFTLSHHSQAAPAHTTAKASRMNAPRHDVLRNWGGFVNSSDCGGGDPVGISACEYCNVGRAMEVVGVCTGSGCKPGHAAGCETA